MATVTGKIVLTSGQGASYIEVSERAAGSLLRDDHFTPGKGDGGVIGSYRALGVPVVMKPTKKRGT